MELCISSPTTSLSNGKQVLHYILPFMRILLSRQTPKTSHSLFRTLGEVSVLVLEGTLTKPGSRKKVLPFVKDAGILATAAGDCNPLSLSPSQLSTVTTQTGQPTNPKIFSIRPLRKTHVDPLSKVVLFKLSVLKGLFFLFPSNSQCVVDRCFYLSTKK